MDSGIAGWMKCVTVNIICKILGCRWTVVLHLECSALQWTLSVKIFHSRWTLLEGSALQWILCENLDNKYNNVTTNYLYFLNFELDEVTWRLLCNAYLKCIAGRVTNKTLFFVPLFQCQYSFLLTKKGLIQKHLFPPQEWHFKSLSSRKAGNESLAWIFTYIPLFYWALSKYYITKCIGLKICLQFST